MIVLAEQENWFSGFQRISVHCLCVSIHYNEPSKLEDVAMFSMQVEYVCVNLEAMVSSLDYDFRSETIDWVELVKNRLVTN